MVLRPPIRRGPAGGHPFGPSTPARRGETGPVSRPRATGLESPETQV